jgi:hypothetical protein
MKYGSLTLGQIEAIVNKLGGMDGVNRLLSGRAKIEIVKHVIDCDVDPLVPSAWKWKMESHEKGGELEWDPTKIKLYLDEGQKNGKTIIGSELQKKLADKPVLNANVLDYLLANPHLIPEEWKSKYIFFWGTVYRNPDGRLYVRYLGWFGDRWLWYSYWLGLGWGSCHSAALRAS